ncbi:MARVEL domain-containing protein 3, partial [Haemorhous mexicanus]|uniref:MARVEL domain-containing protein 3 n=1 Tax=Haemorhous mexicanus TaxID=30427 RepID=UPI0028BE5639
APSDGAGPSPVGASTALEKRRRGGGERTRRSSPRRRYPGAARPGPPAPAPAERGRAGPWRSGAAPVPREGNAPGRAGAPYPHQRQRGRGEAAPCRGRWSAAAACTCTRAGVSAPGGSRSLCPSERSGWARSLPGAPLWPQLTSASPAACCQMVEVLLAVLILVCSSVSCGSAGGYTGLPALGGIYYYQYGGAYSGFGGADGERAQQLDQRFYLLKLPIARAAMVVGGCLLVFPCVLILVSALQVPWHFPAWLLIECTLYIVIAVGTVPALYYFLHSLLSVYNSSLCKEREQLYQSKGYQGFWCSLHGAEIAAGLLGCMAAMAFLLSAGLAVRDYRTVHEQKQKPLQL